MQDGSGATQLVAFANDLENLHKIAFRIWQVTQANMQYLQQQYSYIEYNTYKYVCVTVRKMHKQMEMWLAAYEVATPARRWKK